jgi:hypothetical protein
MRRHEELIRFCAEGDAERAAALAFDTCSVTYGRSADDRSRLRGLLATDASSAFLLC